MSERVEKRSNSASPLNKLGKSIAFGCALGVLVSLLKHQRDEGHLKRSRVEHERAMMSFNSGSNGKSNSNNNRRMGDAGLRRSSESGDERGVRGREGEKTPFEREENQEEAVMGTVSTQMSGSSSSSSGSSSSSSSTRRSSSSSSSLLANIKPLTDTYPNAFALPSMSDEPNKVCEPKTINKDAWGSARRLDFSVAKTDTKWPQNCEGDLKALCEVVKEIAIDREVLAAVANSAAPGIYKFVDSIKSLEVTNFLVICLDDMLEKNLKDKGVATYRVKNDARGSHKISAQKFGIIKDFVKVGCSVLLTDTDVVYLQNPFPYLYRDHDIESMSDGWDNQTANGFHQVIDDAAMGRSGRARVKAFRVSALNSGLWYVAATEASYRLMSIMAHRMATEDLWDQAGYNLELWFASRDWHQTSGATVRVMNPYCFLNSKVMFRIVRHKKELAKDRHRPVAMHANYHTDKERKMQLVDKYYNHDANVASLECTVGCSGELKSIEELEGKHKHAVNDGIIGSKNWKEGAPAAYSSQCAPMKDWSGKITDLGRSLHAISKTPTPPSNDGISVQIDEVLSRKGDVFKGEQSSAIIVSANEDNADHLKVFLERGTKKLKVDKRVIVVTNSPKAANIARTVSDKISVLESSSYEAAILKWIAMKRLLENGVHTIAIDPETVLMHDPSTYFYRDADVEAMSDGWDDMTAYGYDHVVDDPHMDWSRYCHGGRAASRDDGFARFEATEESLALATRVARILLGMKGSSSADIATRAHEAFNEALDLPAHGDYVGPGVIKRTLNYLCFANSKMIYRFAKKDAKAKKFIPVAIRMSYHLRLKETAQRMTDAYNYYEEMKQNTVLGASAKTISNFERWTHGEGFGEVAADSKILCKLRMVSPTESTESYSEKAHVASILSQLGENEPFSWGGVPGLRFLERGDLTTPWGKGKWGFIDKGKGRLDSVSVFAEFAGAKHLLTFENIAENNALHDAVFVSERCTDGDQVMGRVVAKVR